MGRGKGRKGKPVKAGVEMAPDYGKAGYYRTISIDMIESLLKSLQQPKDCTS
jgi:hypothetical protein